MYTNVFPSPYGEMCFYTVLKRTSEVIVLSEFPSPYGEMCFYTDRRRFIISIFYRKLFPSPYGEMCFYTLANVGKQIGSSNKSFGPLTGRCVFIPFAFLRCILQGLMCIFRHALIFLNYL